MMFLQRLMRVTMFAACWLLALGRPAFAADEEFSFGVFGDMPYSIWEEASTTRIMREMGTQPLRFVVHVGDIKDGSSPCTDQLLLRRKNLLEASRHPLVYTPGDNEWTDCSRASAGGYDPRERLQRLRSLFYIPKLTLGSGTLAVRSQRDDAAQSCPTCVENLQWTIGNVVFVTLNVPGSNNNLSHIQAMAAEHHARSRANEVWLTQALQEAEKRNAIGLAIFFQANPRFERGWQPAELHSRDGYAALRALLVRVAQRWKRPMLVVHGDTHLYRTDKPLVDPSSGEIILSVRRIEVHGSPLLGWTRVRVLPQTAELFQVHPLRLQAAE